MILLTDEDIDRIYHGNFWQEIYKRGINPALKAQLKKVLEWGNEPCPHLLDEYGGQLKPECSICWQALLKEVE